MSKFINLISFMFLFLKRLILEKKISNCHFMYLHVFEKKELFLSENNDNNFIKIRSKIDKVLNLEI